MIELPEGWRWATVADVGAVDLGRQRHPDWHNGPEMRPYLRVANVFEDRIDTTDVKEMDFSGIFDRFKLEPGDLLLNEGQTPELLGRPAIYRGSPPDVAFTNSLIRFRAGPEILPEWALIVFRHHMHSGRYRQESRITTNIAHLSARRFKTVEFPVPPLDVQKEIISLVDDQLFRLDGIARNLATVSARTRTMVISSLRMHLGESENEVVLLDKLLATPLVNGRSVPTREGGFPVLRLTSITRDGKVDITQAKPGAWTASEASPYNVAVGDFLVVRGNGSLRLVGRGGMVHSLDSPVAFPDTLVRVRTRNDLVHPEYFALVWNSEVVRRQIESIARTTAGIYKVNQKGLARIEIPLPSLSRQVEISDAMADVSTSATRAFEVIEKSQLRIRTLKKLVLRAACNGILTEKRINIDIEEELTSVGHT
ncbi:hypothetical protein [Nocardia sp. CA-120079]|uniref:hypothetical protein n=1 Tax=Nocardia sp. CA-120079 TaxID=3239974 RepID=UPI003D974183